MAERGPYAFDPVSGYGPEYYQPNPGRSDYSWGDALGDFGPSVVSGGFALAGGALSGHSARQQNREERKWQEYMASTQYQRAVSDMRRAGLNPLMVYGKGSMSSPVGGGARFAEDGVGRGVTEAGARVAQAAVMRAQINDLNSAAALKDAQKDSVDLDNKIKFNTHIGKLDESASGEYGRDWASLGRRERELLEKQIAEVVARTQGISASEAESRARAAYVGVQKRMLEYKESFEVAWAKYWKMVGVTGALAEKGSEVIARLAGSIGVGALVKQIFSGKVRDGGANSAKSAERRNDAAERYFNNQSEDVGR